MRGEQRGGGGWGGEEGRKRRDGIRWRESWDPRRPFAGWPPAPVWWVRAGGRWMREGRGGRRVALRGGLRRRRRRSSGPRRRPPPAGGTRPGSPPAPCDTDPGGAGGTAAGPPAGEPLCRHLPPHSPPPPLPPHRPGVTRQESESAGRHTATSDTHAHTHTKKLWHST